MVQIENIPDVWDLPRLVKNPLESSDAAPPLHVGHIQPSQGEEHVTDTGIKVILEEHERTQVQLLLHKYLVLVLLQIELRHELYGAVDEGHCHLFQRLETGFVLQRFEAVKLANQPSTHNLGMTTVVKVVVNEETK